MNPLGSDAKIRVLVAGVGGASLGTEMIKSLALAGRYEIFACDVSPYAYGLYESSLKKSYLAERNNYVQSILAICNDCKPMVVIPGGEEPFQLLANAAEVLSANGVSVAGNAPEVIAKFSDKRVTFRILQELGIDIPKTIAVRDAAGLDEFPCPCIVKPSRASGGSTSVFLAANRQEAAQYVTRITSEGDEAILQEYIDESEGEFTIGVLHLPDGRLAGSIALRRLLQPKLSHLVRAKAGVISSGYSQGIIDAFPDIRATAEKIAAAAGSRGPLNIQGRVRRGTFLPFEVNARFSASTFLRSLAGFNELDIYLQALLFGRQPGIFGLRRGYYLRSFDECFVPFSEIKA